MSYFIPQNDPRQLKRDIRSVALCVLGFIIIFQVVASTILVAMVFIEHPEFLDPSASSLDVAESSDYLDSYYETIATHGGMAHIIGMMCAVPIMFAIRGKKLVTSDITKTNSKVKLGTIAAMFVLILGAQFILTMIQLPFELLAQPDDSLQTDALNDTINQMAGSFGGILYIVFIGPFFEELVFRGAVMRKLEKYGANFAIVVSALIFGLYHMILLQSVFAFGIGLILAYVAGRFSLKWAVLLHMLNNSMAVLSVNLGSEIFNMILLLCFLLGFIGSIIILVKGRGKLALQKRAGAPSQPRVWQRAFSSPWLIVYMSLTFLAGCASMFGL